MVCDLKLNNPGVRATVLLATFASCGLLLFLTASHFIVRSLTDWRVPISRETLALAASYLPDSPRINARLGEAQLAVAEEREAAIAQANLSVTRAVSQSPFEFRYRTLLASIKEASGDRAAAEQSLRDAVTLAPVNTDVHWRLGNLLVRAGKLDQAAAEMRVAVRARRSLLPGALELLWSFSRGDAGLLNQLAEGDAAAQLALAHFLLKKDQTAAAIRIFNQTTPEHRRADNEARNSSNGFINTLLEKGLSDEAYRCWLATQGIAGTDATRLLWNGGFETDSSQGFDQFAWRINSSKYLRAAIVSSEGKNGSRALRLDFTGQDTTRVDNEITHVIPVSAGQRYKLSVVVRTQNLVTPEGPHIAVLNGSQPIAESAPLVEGSSDWHPVELEFAAPAGAKLLTVAVRRIPKFAYDEPTKGTIWFDDFVIENLTGGRKLE